MAKTVDPKAQVFLKSHLLLNGEVIRKLKQLRRAANVFPDFGFQYIGAEKGSAYQEWAVKNKDPKQVHKFKQFLIKKFPLMDFGAWDRAIYEFFCFHKISDKTAQLASTGCSIVVMKNNKSIPQGIYLKLGLNSTDADIKKFLALKEDEINNAQKKLRGNRKLYKIRDIKNSDRDLILLALYAMPIKNLRMIARATGKITKYGLVRKVLAGMKFGDKQGPILSEDNIKQIVARQRRRGVTFSVYD